MPEGDTLWRTAEVLRAVLGGREVLAAWGRPGGPRVGLLAGRMVERVEARGKHLLVGVSGGLTLHTHLGMHGSWHRYRPGERWRGRRAEAVAVLEVPGAVAVCFGAPTVEVVETRALALHPILSRLGPDLLGPSPDVDAALRRLRMPGRVGLAIGDTLLDQTTQAGIGNVYRSEVCFVESVDPFAPVGSLADETIRRLLRTGRRLLAANASGPFRRTIPDALGNEVRASSDERGARGRALWVYGRAGRPCRRCGTRIRSATTTALARRVYWCPVCQAPGTGAAV